MAGTNFYHCQEGVSGPWFALNCKRVYSMETALCFPQKCPTNWIEWPPL
jgi:hypothetical protein